VACVVLHAALAYGMLCPMATSRKAVELTPEALDVIERAARSEARVVLTRDGAERLAVVSLDDLRRIEEIEAEGQQTDDHPLPEHPYARTLAASGTGRSVYTDVSSNKYRHLADVYADEHDE
jgi:hypothetical protein